jgi:hypothetical protein
MCLKCSDLEPTEATTYLFASQQLELAFGPNLPQVLSHLIATDPEAIVMKCTLFDTWTPWWLSRRLFNLFIEIRGHFLFSRHGIWHGLAACKIQLQGVGVICPPGKHHSENLFFEPKSTSGHILFKCSDFGPAESSKCFLASQNAG